MLRVLLFFSGVRKGLVMHNWQKLLELTGLKCGDGLEGNLLLAKVLCESFWHFRGLMLRCRISGQGLIKLWRR